MAFFQRGELQTSRTALDRSRDAIAAFWPSGRAGPRQWGDCFYTYLLLQEAEKLIEGPAQSQLTE
jgi:hypothetical protein